MKLSATRRDKRILILGKGGTGKTNLVGTLCEVMPTLVVTSDIAGLETLASQGIDPEVIHIQTWRKCWSYFDEIAKLASRFKALAIDDFGNIQETARHKIERMPRYPSEEQAGARFEPQVRRELMLGERTLEMRDWGKMWVAMETFLYEVLALPFEVKLVTVLEDTADDLRTGERRIYPNLQGAMRYSLSARFSLVAEAFIAELDGIQYYCLTSRSHPRIETKDRYGSGRTWVDPTALKLLSYINKKGGAESKIEQAIGTGITG